MKSLYKDDDGDYFVEFDKSSAVFPCFDIGGDLWLDRYTCLFERELVSEKYGKPSKEEIKKYYRYKKARRLMG